MTRTIAVYAADGGRAVEIGRIRHGGAGPAQFEGFEGDRDLIAGWARHGVPLNRLRRYVLPTEGAAFLDAVLEDLDSGGMGAWAQEL